MPAYTPEDVDRLLCEALSAGDLDAVVALYEPGAQFVVGEGQIVTGQDAIRDVMEQFLELQPTLTVHKVTAVQADDIALLSSTWSLDGTGLDGKAIHLSGQGREVVRRHADGAWRFVIDDPNGVS